MERNINQANRTDGLIAVRDLATEFGQELPEFRKWLLRHEFNLGRRLPLRNGASPAKKSVAVLTQREAEHARFIRRHGVVCQEIVR